MISILSLIIYIPTFIIVSLVLWILFKEIRGWTYLQLAKQDGVEAFYIPLRGWSTVYHAPLTLDGYIKKHEDKKALVFNNDLKNGAFYFFHNPKTYKDYFAKESDVSLRSFVLLDTNLGFGDKRGSRAFMQKGFLSDFFVYDNIKINARPIKNIIEQHINNMISKENINSSTKTIVDFKLYTKDLFDDIVNLILFGTGLDEKFPEIFGKKFSVAFNWQMRLKVKAFIKPLNYITGHIFNSWMKEKIEADKIMDELNRVAFEEYQHRYDNWESEQSSHKRNLNILDLMIGHNIKAKNEGRLDDVLDKDEIIGVLNVAVFAGSDTSQSSSNIGLTYICENEDLMEKLYGIFKDDDLYKILSDDVVHRTLLETLRLGNPSSGGLNRVFTKDCVINGINIKKGDMAQVVHGANFRRESWFPNSEKFDIDRHLPENASKLEKGNFIPFSLGKRSCAGKNMGEIMVKLIFTVMLQKFEISKPEDFTRKFVKEVGFAVEKSLLELKLR